MLWCFGLGEVVGQEDGLKAEDCLESARPCQLHQYCHAAADGVAKAVAACKRVCTELASSEGVAGAEGGVCAGLDK